MTDKTTEAVARAIQKYATNQDKAGVFIANRADEISRVAITAYLKALEEPTEAMLNAGDWAISKAPHASARGQGCVGKARAAWQAMLKAAQQEEG